VAISGVSEWSYHAFPRFVGRSHQPLPPRGGPAYALEADVERPFNQPL